MISELDQLLTYSIQNCQDYSSADVALSIFKTDSCLLIPHLKRKKLQKGTSMVTHNSNLPYKRDVSIPSQNVSHNSLIRARNLPSGSQKMCF